MGAPYCVAPFFMKYFIYLFLSVMILSCQERTIIEMEQPACSNLSVINKKIIQKDNSTFLYGGENDSMHFEVDDWNFDKCSLKGGLGREKFQALLNPDYQTAGDTNLLPTDSCLVLFKDNLVLVYPYSVLSFHEAVNEYVGDHPVLVAYCKLANLAVVYDRMICDTEINFAISGYTYAQPSVYNGVRSFIMWDRQTESLWWPLQDLSVSGFFKNTRLEKYNEQEWTNLTWAEIKRNFENVSILYSQEQTTKSTIGRIDETQLDCF